MKKTSLLLALLFLFLIGCSSRPPTLELTMGKTKVPVVAGSYAWKSFAKHVIADSPGPNYLLKDTEPVVAQPGSEIKVKFSRKPERIIWSRWVGNDVVDRIELESNTLILPEEPDEYLYSIRAEWGKDKSGTFAFAVKVE